MSHTPGKWEVLDIRDMGQECLTIAVQGKSVVCRINNTQSGRPIGPDDEANARVIAKAPEMYEKLKRLSAIVLSQSDSMSDETLDIAAEAQELIKEIEG